MYSYEDKLKALERAFNADQNLEVEWFEGNVDKWFKREVSDIKFIISHNTFLYKGAIITLKAEEGDPQIVLNIENVDDFRRDIMNKYLSETFYYLRSM